MYDQNNFVQSIQRNMEIDSKYLNGLSKNTLVDITMSLVKKFGEDAAKIIRKFHDDYHEKNQLLRSSLPKSPKEKNCKVSRSFDISKQRHVALRLQYDGEKYLGFAAQSGEFDETVEKHVFKALTKVRLIENREVIAVRVRSAFPSSLDAQKVPKHPYDSYIETDLQSNEQFPVTIDDGGGAERVEGDNPPRKKNRKEEVVESNTDPDVAAFTSATSNKNNNKKPKEIREVDYCNVLNRALPEDIRVLGWTEVTDNFSARFSATDRTYRYFFVRRKLDIVAMNEAAQYLIGEHDFRNLCKMDVANVSNFRREIYSAEILPFQEDVNEPEHSVYILQIRGIAFLWHMVRCIMAVLLLVGERTEAPEVINRLLDVETFPAKPDYQMANENGLVLHQSGYGNLKICYQARVLHQLMLHFNAIWERHHIAAAKAQNALRFLLDCELREDDAAELLNFLKLQDHGHPSDSTESVVWRDIWQQIQRHDRISLRDSTTYIPLLKRKVGSTYDERVQRISGGRKERFERHQQPADPSTGFFSRMRSQGSLL